MNMENYSETTKEAIRMMLAVSKAAVEKNVKFWIDAANHWGQDFLFVCEQHYAEREDYWSAGAVRDAIKRINAKKPDHISKSMQDTSRTVMRQFASNGIFFNSNKDER